MENTARKIEEVKSNVGLNGRGPMAKQAETFVDQASEFASRIGSTSSELAKEGVNFARKYPVYTALGAVAVGYLAGIFLRRSK